MKLSDFHYHLPEQLITHYPLPERSASRLLSLNADTGQCQHLQFSDITTLLRPGDLLVFNDTKVIPARLFGNKASGGKVEIMVERILDEQRLLARVRASKSPKPGSSLFIDNQVEFEVIERVDEFYLLHLHHSESAYGVLKRFGHIPLPPYIDRDDEALDHKRYQTVYAKREGAVAAPTAGLHFDDALLQKITDLGVQKAFVTLHVGSGTFQPVRTDDIQQHKMHKEMIDVSEDLCITINETKRQGGRVIAVGTTSVRCLETACLSGTLKPYQGDTDIFIYPGFEFRCVDVLITNFHLPESTLMMLICAFAGYDNVMAAYQEAITQEYRFFSYGDAMFIM